MMYYFIEIARIFTQGFFLDYIFIVKQENGLRVKMKIAKGKTNDLIGGQSRPWPNK